MNLIALYFSKDLLDGVAC